MLVHYSVVYTHNNLGYVMVIGKEQRIIKNDLSKTLCGKVVEPVSGTMMVLALEKVDGVYDIQPICTLACINGGVVQHQHNAETSLCLKFV